MTFGTSDIINLFSLTKDASSNLALANSETKNQILFEIALGLEEHMSEIIQENAKDLVKMKNDDPMRDRLLLNEDRIKSLANSVRDITLLADPAGVSLMSKTLKNGLFLEKMAVPLGVVGVIYESRPNVTIDVAALCIRSGNAVVLRGGTDAWYSNNVLVKIVHLALSKCGFSTDLVLLMPTDREHVSTLLTAVKYIDVIIPRGSEALIQRVRKESLVPTIETGAGVCHTYVSEFADLTKAIPVVVNAKVSRPSVCNSLDTIILHKNQAEEFLSQIAPQFLKFNVNIYADILSYEILSSINYPLLQIAEDSDFGREFLNYACSIKIVSSLKEALKHISAYSSRHSEAIVTEDESEANYFLKTVDAAAVYWNASTRFTDGGVFELGAEIGISTQKLHARGPFALEKLVTEKWIIKGNGQIR